MSVQTHHANLVHYVSLAKTANNQSQILQWSICKLAWRPGAIINGESVWLQCESCWPNLRMEGRWWFDGALPNRGNWNWALMISGTVARRSSTSGEWAIALHDRVLIPLQDILANWYYFYRELPWFALHKHLLYVYYCCLHIFWHFTPYMDFQ